MSARDAALAEGSSNERIPFTAKHRPRPLRGRTFSDNVLLTAVRPA